MPQIGSAIANSPPMKNEIQFTKSDFSRNLGWKIKKEESILYPIQLRLLNRQPRQITYEETEFFEFRRLAEARQALIRTQAASYYSFRFPDVKTLLNGNGNTIKDDRYYETTNPSRNHGFLKMFHSNQDNDSPKFDQMCNILTIAG